MGVAGYWWERFCLLSFAPFLIWTATVNPAYFGHLTYWTLCVHAVYFTVDKASPHASTAVLVLHGLSFAGAMAILAGYTFISLGGLYRFGSWLAWENAVGARAGTVHHNRQFAELAFQKAYEHLWPVIAILVDARLSRDALAATLKGLPKLRTTVISVGSFLLYATIWEQTTKVSGKGTPLDVYVQPTELATSAILGKLGISAPDLPEDLIFTNAQKATLIAVAFAAYWKVIAPLCADAKAKPATRKTKAK